MRDVEGRVLSHGTFACAAVIPPRFDTWLAWLEPAFGGSNADGSDMHSGEIFAALSLAIGLATLVTHQFLIIGTSTDTSLWALKPSLALAPPSGSSSVATPTQQQRWPWDGLQGRRNTDLTIEQLISSRKRRRRSAHTIAVGLFSIVDVFTSTTLYFELATVLVFVMPYRLSVISYVLVAAAVKTTVVAGRLRRQWLHAFPWVRSWPDRRWLRLTVCMYEATELTMDRVIRVQFMWAIVPQLAQAQWALRRGSWWHRWLAFLVVLSERCALISGLTLLSCLFPRADYVLWASMWRRLAVLWALFGVEVALIGVVTWTKAQADAMMRDLRPQELADHCNAAERSVTPAEVAERALAQVLPQVQLGGGRSAVAPLPIDICAEVRRVPLPEESGPGAH